MKKKRPAQLYFKMFWSYTAIVVCIVSALVFYFISDSQKRILENNRQAMERINREAADYIEDTESISDYLFQDLYRTETELEDLLAYLSMESEEYLRYGLDRYSAEDNLVYRGIYNFINDAFEAYHNLEKIEVISYDTLTMTQCYPQKIFYPGKDGKTRLEQLEEPDFKEEGKLLYIKEVRNPNNMKSAGCLIFTFEGEKRFQKIKDNSYTELMVCNQEDQVIFTEPSLENWEERMNDRDYLNLKESGNFYTVYTFLNSSQASALPVQTLVMILAAGAAAAALGILGIGYYVRRLTRRVDSILYAMGQVTKGNLQTRLQVNKKGDELDMVAEHFNQMCEDLNLYIQKSYLAEIERKNAQMQALQSQINPHFLYNTLEAIRMKAICNGDREVGKMLYSMVTLFRSQLKEADVITLGQELDYCKQYMELFEYRYQGSFASKVSCPVELLSVPIIKFVLQPIVENYFVHGIERDREDNLVKIWVQTKGNALNLYIEDNGKGMAKEDIDRVNRELKENLQEKRENKSIGIANVNRRIKAVYGDQYGLLLQAAVPKGLLVIVTIPLSKEGEIEEKEKDEKGDVGGG